MTESRKPHEHIEPKATRPYMPDYGSLDAWSGRELLAWSWVTERIGQAQNYWLATTHPNGLPHMTPVPCKTSSKVFYSRKPAHPSVCSNWQNRIITHYGAHNQMGWFILKHIFSTILSIINITRLSNQEKDLEILILRQQLSILQRKHNSPIQPNRVEKITLAVLTARLKRITHRSANQLRDIIRIFQPETILRWHRELVRRKWTYPHKNRGGRPSISKELEELILRLAHENPRWGYGKIQGELVKLSFKVSQSTVRNILDRHGIQPVPVRNSSIGWRHLMTHYKEQILACDFFTIDTVWLQTIYVLFFIELGSRRIHFAGVTSNPNQTWITQQARQLVWELHDRGRCLQFLIHDNDCSFSKAFDAVFESEGIYIIHTPFQAPNANAHAERWVRTVREECLDHILIINAEHLQRVLIEFAQYYNASRPHQGIDQQTPIPPNIPKNTGFIQRRKVLGGMINDYFRSSDRCILSTL